jgi:hypothetical protein
LKYAAVGVDFFPSHYLEQNTELHECEVYQNTLPPLAVWMLAFELWIPVFPLPVLTAAKIFKDKNTEAQATTYIYPKRYLIS